MQRKEKWLHLASPDLLTRQTSTEAVQLQRGLLVRHRTALRHRYCSLQFDPPHPPSTIGVERWRGAGSGRETQSETDRCSERQRGPERRNEAQCIAEYRRHMECETELRRVTQQGAESDADGRSVRQSENQAQSENRGGAQGCERGKRGVNTRESGQ